MSKRFIAEQNNIAIADNVVKVEGEAVHHINVLRYNTGDRLYINEYEIEITSISKDRLEGTIVGNMPKNGEARINITLIQSYLKSDKMDYVVQKATELGVKNIIPVITKNTVVKLETKDRIKKKERLEKIVKEAIGQCGRTDGVNIRDISNLKEINLNVYDATLVCHETSDIPLKETLNNLKGCKNIAIIIGPEGGLDDLEVKSILEFPKSYEVSLGERVLRAETASLCVLSIVDYFFDN